MSLAGCASAEKAELFDEFEEWVLMSTHYCMALAVKATAAPVGDSPPGVDASKGSSGAPGLPSLVPLLFQAPSPSAPPE